jgi:integrase/recombinase XerC
MQPADFLEEWVAHLRDARRRSPHTVRAYCACAGRLLKTGEFAAWSDVAALEAHDLRRHLAARRAEGIGNASAARELSALKSFITFAREKAGDPDAAAPRLKGPRVKKGLPRPVTPDDAGNLADLVAGEAAQEWIGARDRAVLLLLMEQA